MRTVHPRPRLTHYLKGRLASIEATHVDFVDVPYVLDGAERQLVECERLQIQGLEKLGTDVSTLTKLQSVLSELRVASIFARLGSKVTVLKDQAFGAFYAPDLQVTCGGLDFLVEVHQARPALPNVSTPLDQALKEAGLPFAVEASLGLELSVPRIGCAERQVQEVRVAAVVAKVIQELSRVPAGNSGEIAVGEHFFQYEPSALDSGYAAGGTTSVHYIDDSAQGQKFLRALRRKAKEQPKLPPAWRTKPFIVAYDNRESELLPHMVLSVLTGPRNAYPMGNMPPISHPPAVVEAWKSGWQTLLQAWDYGPEAVVRFRDGYGAFGSATWAGYLSGVLVIHSARSIQWLPNPFAVPPIREVRLLDLGLPIVQLEAYVESLAS